MVLKWDKNLETGLDRIDDQHRHLFGKLGEFQEACEKKTSVLAMLELFNFIDRYVISHFVVEEAYMFGEKYPKIEEHRRAHNELKEEYAKIRSILEKEDLERIHMFKANRFLSEWWVDHVCHMDKRMVQFVRKHPSNR
jgi:hemerythrin